MKYNGGCACALDSCSSRTISDNGYTSFGIASFDDGVCDYDSDCEEDTDCYYYSEYCECPSCEEPTECYYYSDYCECDGSCEEPTECYYYSDYCECDDTDGGLGATCLTGADCAADENGFTSCGTVTVDGAPTGAGWYCVSPLVCDVESVLDGVSTSYTCGATNMMLYLSAFILSVYMAIWAKWSKWSPFLKVKLKCLKFTVIFKENLYIYKINHFFQFLNSISFYYYNYTTYNAIF